MLALVTAGALVHVGVRMKGIEVAYALGKERKLNTELEEERRRLHIEIGMLKDPDRVVGIARDKLQMGPPRPGDIVRGPRAGAGAAAPVEVAVSRRGPARDRRTRAAMIGATRWTRIRLIACGVVFGALFVAVGKRAFNLQIGEGERLHAMAEEQYLREIELPPRRGRILDRNGAELASTADVDSIYCNPRRFADARDAARRLARVLGLDARELEKKLAQRRYFAWVKRKVTPDEAAAVRALELPGVAFVREPRRFYPNRIARGDGHGPGRARTAAASTASSSPSTKRCAAAPRRCRGCATRSGASCSSSRRPTRPAAPAATSC